jgi:iron complex transport system substrate-binding protein
MKRCFLSIFILFTTLLTFHMVSVQAAATANLTDSCVTTYDPNIDYFPDKITVQYAEGFKVEYRNNYKVVTVTSPWQGAENPVRYLLVQCGTPAPTDAKVAALVVNVPVKTIVSMSTTFLPHLDGQGLVDRIVGMDSFLYTSTPSVLKRIDAKQIAEVGGGGGGTEVNVEKLIDLQPGLIMAQRYSDQDKTYPAMRDAGLPVVLNADFLDTSPLGQAEWGKYIALYFNTESKAERLFDGVAKRYNDYKALTAKVTDKPTVMANSAYQGTWYMPGGKSYLAQLIADAGGAYLWADDTSTGSLTLSFESVFDKASKADYWININLFWNTTADALADDARYGDFAAFKNGKVFNNNARVNANGGDDYFESGVANPDVLLADLITIFHPDLLPDHALVYYKKLESK